MTAQITVTEGGIPHNTLMIYGLIGSLVGIYLTYLNTVTGTQLFSFFGGLGAVAALIWGSSTIKRLCSYGIGTGVPSAGMLAFGSGVIAMLLATKFGIVIPDRRAHSRVRDRRNPRLHCEQHPRHEDPGHDPVDRRTCGGRCTGHDRLLGHGHGLVHVLAPLGGQGGRRRRSRDLVRGHR